MDLIKKINSDLNKIKKFFKNKKFKSDIKREKSKKYLYNKTESKISFFDLYKNKKRWFSLLISTLWDKTRKLKVHFFVTWMTLLILNVYIIFISPYFKISPSKVIIERLDTITDINIAYKSIENVYWNSIFLIDQKNIKNSMTWMQKNIKSIEITRLFPNWLKIIVESYKPEFSTKFSWIDKSYIITSNWVLIYEKNINKILYNLEINDNNLIESGFFDYKEWVSTDTMKKIIFTRDLFKSTFSNKNIWKFIYFKLENELHITLDSGIILIFELNEDIHKQVALLRFYNDTNKDILNTWGIFYIDSRIIWKIFSCKDKNLCRKNLVKIYWNYYK